MKILLAAKELFARQGFGETTVRQICELAGANVALVSYYFGGKDGLFEAVFETFFPIDQIQSFAVQDIDPEEGLRFLIREVIRFRFRDPDLLMMLEQEIVLRSPRTEVLRRYSLPTWGVLRELLRRGKEQGVFSYRDLDCTQLFIMGVILFPKRWGFFRPMLDAGEPTAEELAEDTWLFVRKALRE